ncbi:MAG: UTP--glucose-1-phosphate uridylyltransferase GalU [Oligoflexia bacterium]|nr:UTP--glucose-1-phosphate uridylyltransferase GalU [Oligoflexia bacterium]
MIKKAVIPVAGLGTRFLPATKAVPKEMLPIVDRPIILHVVEEAIAAGIEDIIFVTGRHKTAIEEFFDHNYELEDTLERQGKKDLLELTKRISNMVNVISVRQKNPKGLGHAVLAAKSIVGNSPFAVLLGDEVMDGSPTVTQQLAKVYETEGLSTVAVMEIPKEDVKKYGIVKVAPHKNKKTFKILDVVEKPNPQDAPSRWALPGRYVFSPDIFKYLEETKPSKGGEIQLTDAMTKLAAKEGLLAYAFDGLRFDAGDKLGYIGVNLEFALRHPEIGTATRQYVLDLAKRLTREES